MKRTLRKTLRLAVPVLAFLFQLWRISALLAALAAWAAVELLAWLCVKFRNRRCDRNNS